MAHLNLRVPLQPVQNFIEQPARYRVLPSEIIARRLYDNNRPEPMTYTPEMLEEVLKSDNRKTKTDAQKHFASCIRTSCTEHADKFLVRREYMNAVYEEVMGLCIGLPDLKPRQFLFKLVKGKVSRYTTNQRRRWLKEKPAYREDTSSTHTSTPMQANIDIPPITNTTLTSPMHRDTQSIQRTPTTPINATQTYTPTHRDTYSSPHTPTLHFSTTHTSTPIHRERHIIQHTPTRPTNTTQIYTPIHRDTHSIQHRVQHTPTTPTNTSQTPIHRQTHSPEHTPTPINTTHASTPIHRDTHSLQHIPIPSINTTSTQTSTRIPDTHTHSLQFTPTLSGITPQISTPKDAHSDQTQTPTPAHVNKETLSHQPSIGTTQTSTPILANKDTDPHHSTLTLATSPDVPRQPATSVKQTASAEIADHLIQPGACVILRRNGMEMGRATMIMPLADVPEERSMSFVMLTSKKQGTLTSSVLTEKGKKPWKAITENNFIYWAKDDISEVLSGDRTTKAGNGEEDDEMDDEDVAVGVGSDGEGLGTTDGEGVGFTDGEGVGSTDGEGVGSTDGEGVGSTDGEGVGSTDGEGVGSTDGEGVGSTDGEGLGGEELDGMDAEELDGRDEGLKVGEIVAVAWEDNWYVGEVREIREGGPRVAFMHRRGRSKCMMGWPGQVDVQTVDVRQVIQRNVELNGIYQSRQVQMGKEIVESLDRDYKEYAEKFIK